jgi:hypothetical protein
LAEKITPHMFQPSTFLVCLITGCCFLRSRERERVFCVGRFVENVDSHTNLVAGVGFFKYHTRSRN